MYVFFFNDTATTEIYTLSLHDALPIYEQQRERERDERRGQVERDHDAAEARRDGRDLGRRRRGLQIGRHPGGEVDTEGADRKSTRLNSSHANISYAVFCLKKKNIHITP